MRSFRNFIFLFLMLAMPGNNFASDLSSLSFEGCSREQHYYIYNPTPLERGTCDQIRARISSLIKGDLPVRYRGHIEKYDPNKFSKNFACHQHALATFLGYERKMPKWLYFVRSPEDFDYGKYFKPTAHPQEGDLVVYYDKTGCATHVGLMGSAGFVFSTWGYGNDWVCRHRPFLVPRIYGKKIIAWRPKPGKTPVSIRNEIEAQVIEDILNTIPNQDRDHVGNLVKTFQNSNVGINTLCKIIRELSNIPKNKRQGIVEDTHAIIQNCQFQNVDLIIKSLAEIAGYKRSEIAEAARSLISSTATRSGLTPTEMFTGRYLQLILRSLSYLDTDCIPRILQATTLLTQPNMKKQEVSDILISLINMEHKIDVLKLAEAASPLFVKGMNTFRLCMLFHTVTQCIQAGQEHLIVEFRNVVEPDILLGTTYDIVHHLEAFIENKTPKNIKAIKSCERQG